MVNPTSVSMTSPRRRSRGDAAPAMGVPALDIREMTARATRLVGRQLAAVSQHDLDAVVAGFRPDARIVTGHRGPPVEGEQALRIYVASLYAQFPGLALELLSCSCGPGEADDRHDGSGSIVCEVRWLARWHDPDSGRLVHQTSGGHYRIVGEQVVELWLHAWPTAPLNGMA